MPFHLVASQVQALVAVADTDDVLFAAGFKLHPPLAKQRMKIPHRDERQQVEFDRMFSRIDRVSNRGDVLLPENLHFLDDCDTVRIERPFGGVTQLELAKKLVPARMNAARETG